GSARCAPPAPPGPAPCPAPLRSRGTVRESAPPPRLPARRADGTACRAAARPAPPLRASHRIARSGAAAAAPGTTAGRTRRSSSHRRKTGRRSSDPSAPRPATIDPESAYFHAALDPSRKLSAPCAQTPELLLDARARLPYRRLHLPPD